MPAPEGAVSQREGETLSAGICVSSSPWGAATEVTFEVSKNGHLDQGSLMNIPEASLPACLLSAMAVNDCCGGLYTQQRQTDRQTETERQRLLYRMTLALIHSARPEEGAGESNGECLPSIHEALGSYTRSDDTGLQCQHPVGKGRKI